MECCTALAFPQPGRKVGNRLCTLERRAPRGGAAAAGRRRLEPGPRQSERLADRVRRRPAHVVGPQRRQHLDRVDDQPGFALQWKTTLESPARQGVSFTSRRRDLRGQSLHADLDGCRSARTRVRARQRHGQPVLDSTFRGIARAGHRRLSRRNLRRADAHRQPCDAARWPSARRRRRAAGALTAARSVSRARARRFRDRPAGRGAGRGRPRPLPQRPPRTGSAGSRGGGARARRQRDPLRRAGIALSDESGCGRSSGGWRRAAGSSARRA